MARFPDVFTIILGELPEDCFFPREEKRGGARRTGVGKLWSGPLLPLLVGEPMALRRLHGSSSPSATLADPLAIPTLHRMRERRGALMMNIILTRR
jgi:hypothetical protein